MPPADPELHPIARFVEGLSRAQVQAVRDNILTEIANLEADVARRQRSFPMHANDIDITRDRLTCARRRRERSERRRPTHKARQGLGLDVTRGLSARARSTANIANGPQQVNNAPQPGVSRAGNSVIQQSKLLEQQRNEWLDAGTAQAPGSRNSTVEALGSIHGTQDDRR